MRNRKHHNNKGYRQIKSGKCRKQLIKIAKKLKIKYGTDSKK